MNFAPIDVDSVFSALESARMTGNLSAGVTGARVIYQASCAYATYLEPIHPNGHVVVGRFDSGTFTPRSS